MVNPQLVILCVASTFAAVLEAAPSYYPEPSLAPQHQHRYYRQTDPYPNAGKRYQRIDQHDEDEDLYELRPSYEYQRYPRNDFMSINPRVVRDKGIPRYVVPSIAEDSEYQMIEDNLNYSPNYRELDPFPISMMRQENQRQVLTDKELGKILRKALESANYGEVERASSIKRFNSAPTRQLPRGSGLAYVPQARNNYPRRSNEPKTDILAELAPEPVDGTPKKDADDLLVDALDEFDISRSETDLVATIAESAESPEDADPSLTASETEPVTHLQVADDEESSDDDVQKDDILAIIEYEDREDEGNNDEIVPTASPVKEEDSEVTENEEDFSLADDIHEPLIPTEELHTRDSITDATIEPTAE